MHSPCAAARRQPGTRSAWYRRPSVHCSFLLDGDIERLVDALRPVAAAARLQLQQIGIKVLDVGGEIELLGDVVVADVAIGDQAHADFGVGIGIDDRGRDRPDLALGAPSIRPPIEPVVSSTKATSTVGFAMAGDRPAGRGRVAVSECERAKREALIPEGLHGFSSLCSVPPGTQAPWLHGGVWPKTRRLGYEFAAPSALHCPGGRRSRIG